MEAPHGWGRGTAATKQTSPQLHLPLFPQNREPSEHTVGSADQEYREEVWTGGGMRETVTDSIWKMRKSCERANLEGKKTRILAGALSNSAL